MHIPILIVGATELARRKHIEAHIAKQIISPFDLHTISVSDTKKSIGISQVKSLISQLLLSPVQGAAKAGIIYELQYATPEAQNALLKLLEEPDPTTILVASASRVEEVLPTIISRCRIITIESTEPSDRAGEAPHEIIDILASNEAKRLEFAEQLAKESRITQWSINATRKLREILLKHTSEYGMQNTEYRVHIISTIRMLERARTSLEKTNTNQRLLLENLLLELPSMQLNS